MMSGSSSGLCPEGFSPWAVNWEVDKYRSLAQDGLQRYIETLKFSDRNERVTKSIAVLACAMQLVSFEMFFSGNGGWQLHLQAAATVLPQILNHLASNSRDETHEKHKSTVIWMGMYVWWDILSRISACSSSTSLETSRKILTKGNVEMKTITGCEDWIMLQILEIAELDEWKREAKSQKKLSMKELVSRADKIELNIEKEIRRRQTSSDRSDFEEMVRCITNIYACSALVYVHVVASGFNSELPEIREAVARSIEAFNALPDPFQMRSLAWPFCIAGCMAAKSQEDVFRGMVAAAGITESSAISCWTALGIMESHWGRRHGWAIEGEGLDWAAVVGDKLLI